MPRNRRYHLPNERKLHQPATSYLKRNRSRSPSRLRQRSRSPSRLRQRSRSPSRLRQRSRSPSRLRQRSRSPSRLRQRSRSPSRYFPSSTHTSPHNYGGSKSPPRHQQESNFSHYLEKTGVRSRSPNYSVRNRPPSQYTEQNRSPPHWSSGPNDSPPRYLNRSESPPHYLRGNESPLYYVRRNESPPHYLRRNESPPHYSKRSESPPHYLTHSESPPHHYSRESESPAPPPDLGFEFSSYLDRDESPTDNEEKRGRKHDNTITWSTSEKEAFHFTQYANGPLNSDTENINGTHKKFFHPQVPVHLSEDQERPLKRYLKRKITSLEEADQMTDQEIDLLQISGASKKKVKILTSQGIPFIDAKRRIVKENFIRHWNSKLKLKEEIASSPQYHAVVSAASQGLAKAKSCTQTTNKQAMDVSSQNSLHPPRNDLPGDQGSKKPKSKISTPPKRDGNSPKETSGVMIVHNGYPEIRMNRDQLTALQTAIMLALEDLDIDGPQIRFEKCRFRFGYLVVTCTDQSSADWLRSIVPRLKPWSGADLKTLGNDMVPKCYKCTVLVPDENGERLSAERILNRLAASNKGLNSLLWATVAYKTVHNGQLWAFTIDAESFTMLEKLKMRPYFGFSTLTFRPKGRQAQKHRAVQEVSRTDV